MAYVNFTDINNNIVTTSLGYDFMTKDTRVRITDKLKLHEVEELINQSTVRYTFYLYALYDDETVKLDLSNYVIDGGSYTINYACGIRRKFSISIYNAENWQPHPFKGFLWKGSKFKLEIGLKTALAEYIYPAGIFILEDFEIPHQYKINQITLNAVDKFGGLDGTVGGKIIDGIYIPRGSNIVQMVKSLLKSEKFEGCCFDNKSPLFPSWTYTATTPYTISESSDSTIGDIIKKLVSIINLDVFYDECGRMCFEEMRENLLVDTLPPLWTFTNDANIYTAHTMKMDFQSVENVVEVEGANLNGNIINVRVSNTNPKSPTNISVFEPTICKVVDENIADIASATLRGEYELFKRSLLPISMSFSSVLIPILNVNNVVLIDDEYCNLYHSRFLINSITIPVSSVPKMNMTIANLEEVAFSG